MRKVVPLDWLLATSSWPPSSRAYSWLSNTPIPMPADLVDSKGLNKPFADELLAHAMPCILDLDDRGAICLGQANHYLVRPWGWLRWRSG